MATTIYLIRHAECVGNTQKRLTGRTDFKLSEEGKEQVLKITDRLKNIKFDRIYSSPYRRAVETVKPLAKLENIEIELSDEISEMYFGIYDGMTWDEINSINPEIAKVKERDWVIKNIPTQETVDEVVHRMDEFIRKVAKENDGKTILICSHGLAIEVFLRNITKEYFSTKKLGYSQANTAVNILEYEKDKFKIIEKANVDHLG